MTRGTARHPAPALFWLLLRAHWIAGAAPLFFLTDLPRPALAATSAAFLAGAALDWTGAQRPGWQRLAAPLVLLILLAAAADLFLGSRDMLASVSLLVLGIQSVKFLLPKKSGDGWQLCAIAFLEFLSAAAVTSEIHFAGFLFLFLGLSAGAMWALHLEEQEELRDAAAAVRPGFAVPVLLLAALSGALLTAALFVVIPRVGIGQIARRLGPAAGISGFSDRISLRDVTSVKADRRVVARVEFPEPAPGLTPTGLYLKGAAYSSFDGTSWTRREHPGERVPRAGFHYLLAPPPRGAYLSLAEIVLEPMRHAALFVYGEPVAVEGDLGELRADASGNLYLPGSLYSAVRYRVRFAEGAPPRRASALPAGADYLALPPGMEEVRALAREVTGGGRSDKERAELARRFFRSGFRYSVADAASSVLEFLFVKKAGFCEHYATGLALLLRAAGIPARVAAGYLGGEWSGPGSYLIVRQSDAHAWTEAWIEGRWVTLDATPPLGEDSPFFSRTGILGIYLDWGRQRWNKYVINYSLRMQAQAVSQGWSAVRRGRRGIRRALAEGDGVATRAAAGAVLLGACAALFAWRRRCALGRSRSGVREAGVAPLPRPYARLLRTLGAGGHRKFPGATMEAMLRLAAAAAPALEREAARFLLLYHRDRFGPGPLSQEDRREARRLADVLRREIRGAFRRTPAPPVIS